MADTLSLSSSASRRRASVRAYKEAFPPMGIYAVRNAVTGRVWLGASRDAEAALNRIRFELRFRGHRHPGLTAEWRQHGDAAFSFEVIDRVKQRDDAAFDYDAELQASLSLWQAELEGELL
jgi:hypothetical protein